MDNKERCGEWLERAGVPCARPAGHRAAKHLSQLAVDNDKARQARYYLARKQRKEVAIMLRTDISVREDLRSYAESSGRQQHDILHAALTSYLTGYFV